MIHHLKKLYQYITILSCVLMVSSCSKVTDWEKQGLHGKVQSYTENHHETDGEPKNWRRGPEIFTLGKERVSFDEDGNHNLRELLHKDNSIIEKTVIERTDDGSIIQTSYDDTGKVISKTESTFQSDQNIGFVQYDGDGKKLLDGFMLLEDQRVVRQEVTTYFENDDGSKYITELTYDKDGNMTSEKTTRNGNAFSHYNFTYVKFDEQNNWTERLDYMSSEPNRPNKIVAREYVYYN